MLKKIMIAIVVLIGGLFIFASVQKPDFSYSRDILINASPEAIFAQINDFHKFAEWNPWGKIDPAARVTVRGSGPGSFYGWDGNSEVGSGSMKILDSTPNSVVHYQVDFKVPFESTAFDEFTITPEGTQSRVKWTMSGKNSIIARVFCTFMDMNKMMTGMFDKGLADLKKIAESK